MHNRLFGTVLLSIVFLAACSSKPVEVADTTKPYVTTSDFTPLIGDTWKGSLTYLDYSSAKTVTIPTQATIEIANPTTIKYSVSYPEEPWEDSHSKIKIGGDGLTLDGQKVTSRRALADGNVEIQTEYRGEDDGKPADIRMTYMFGPNAFSMAKDVRFDQQATYINRNTYTFER